MKKVLTFLVIVSMIAFGSAVMARGVKDKGNGRRNGSCRYSQQTAKSGVYQKQKRKNAHIKAIKGKGKRLKGGSGNERGKGKGMKGKGNEKRKGKGMKGKGNGKRLKNGSKQQKKNQYKGSKGKKNGGTTTTTDSTIS